MTCSGLDRLRCPVHGWSRAARALRRVLDDQEAASHIAWSAQLAGMSFASKRVRFSAWEPVLNAEGVMSHMEVAIYREDGTREVLPPPVIDALRRNAIQRWAAEQSGFLHKGTNYLAQLYGARTDPDNHTPEEQR